MAKKSNTLIAIHEGGPPHTTALVNPLWIIMKLLLGYLAMMLLGYWRLMGHGVRALF